MIACFLSNISAKYYKNPSMLSRVIAKNVGDVFFETQCILENDKIMPFQPRQPSFLSVWASCRTGWKWTSSLRRTSGPKLSTSGAPRWKGNINSSWSLRWLMSWNLLADHLERADTATHQQGVVNFTKCLMAYMAVAANDRYSKHLQ